MKPRNTLRTRIYTVFAVIILIFAGFAGVAVFAGHIGIILGAAAVALGFIIFLMDKLLRLVADPAAQLAQSAKNLIEGNLKNMTKHESDDEFGQLSDSLAHAADTLIKLQEAEKAIAGYEKELDDMSNHIEKLANGELSAIRTGYGQKSRHMTAALALSRTLHEIAADIQNLVSSAASGDFKKRLAAEKYSGDWQKLAYSMNGLMEALGIPIEQAKAAMDAVAAGKLDVKVEADAKGELLKLKASTNNATAALGKYVKTITDALENIDRNSKFQATLPNDFAPIKTAIAELSNNTARTVIDRPPAKAAIPAAHQIAASTAQPHGRIGIIPKKFSGAKRIEGLEASKEGIPSYMKSDFGKY